MRDFIHMISVVMTQTAATMNTPKNAMAILLLQSQRAHVLKKRIAMSRVSLLPRVYDVTAAPSETAIPKMCIPRDVSSQNKSTVGVCLEHTNNPQVE